MTDDSTNNDHSPEQPPAAPADANDQPSSAEAAAAAPIENTSSADTGYVLSRRDRTAVKLIDWAVGIGTPEFQARYKPVSDELFTHHFIDPTAKPAFVPPALVSIEQLDAESDPLEVIRSHLGLVVDDRQARDKARIDAQTHYEEASSKLAEAQARGAALDAELAETSARLQTAEAQVAELSERLETETSTLRAERDAQIGELTGGFEAQLAELRADSEQKVSQLTAENAASLTALAGSHDSTVGGLTAEHETALADAEQRRIAELDAAESARLAEVSELQSQHDQAIAELERSADEREVAGAAALAAAVAANEVTSAQLREARLESGSLTAQRDRAVAEGSEWRSRLQRLVAGLAGTAEVGEWTDSNAPDDRVIEFIEQTQLDLTAQLELARATLDEIEDVATAQLVDESETADYAIGANDAAVLVLNSLYGATDDEDAGLDEDAALDDTLVDDQVSGDQTPAAASAVASDDGATGAISESDGASGDAEFAAELRDDVDVEFTEYAGEAEHRAS